MRKIRILLLFVAAAAVFLGPTVLGTSILSQADAVYFFPPWSACRPAELARASNPLLGDQSTQFYPYRYFARQQVRAGEVPLWNPFILMGTPFLADMQSAVFSPFHLFSYLGDLKTSFAWSALCRLLTAGLGMYYLCRLFAISTAGAVLAGIGFMFCAFQVVWLNHPHTHVSVLLPWAFVAAEESVTRPSLRAALIMAAVVATLFFGGHPETVLHIAMGTVVFFLYRVGQTLHKTRNRFALAAPCASAVGGALLGLGLAAIVLVPFAELLWSSGVWEARGSFARNPFVLPPSVLLTTVAPDLFGNPARGTDYGPANYNERDMYAGFLPLLLALLALRWWRHDWRVRFFSGWGLFSLTIILGLWPIFDLVTWLPVLHHTANHRLVLLWQFCVALLAGVSADHILRAEQAGTVTLPRRFLTLAGSLTLLPFILWLILQLGILPQNPKILYGALLPLLFAATAFGLFELLRRNILSLRTWGAAACLLTFLDLFIVGRSYNPAVPREHVFDCVPDSVRFLQQQEGIFRVTAVEGLLLLANTSMMYGLQDVRGYELPAPGRLGRFFTDGLHGFYDGAHYEPRDLTPQTLRLLSLANVRYLLSTRDLTNVSPALTKAYEKEIFIHENSDVLPRAFIVHQVREASDERDALAKVTDSSIDLKEVGILEAADNPDEKLPLQAPHSDQPPTGACVDKADISRYEPHQVHVQVESCGPGVVILTDTYYRGWQVYVDGVEQPLRRANYLFRGVSCGSGRHEIRFVYQPFSYTLGVAITAGSALLCLLLLGYAGIPGRFQHANCPRPTERGSAPFFKSNT